MKRAFSIPPGTCVWLTWLLTALAAPGQDTQRQYLSGHGKDDPVPWKFLCMDGPRSGVWTNLPVPSNWELFGFGTLHYQTEPANMFEEVGKYEREFAVPSNWAQRRVFLVFDGVMTDTHAELNGESVGPDHQGSFYRFKYEITHKLKPGAQNRLEVQVHKRSANAGVNHAERQGDYWLFGGIFRPVYLEAVPPQFIERVAIDARADGSFSMDVFANTGDGPSDGLSAEAQIMDLKGKAAGSAFSQPMEGGHVTLKHLVVSPQLWTAETPNLYQVEVRLQRAGKLLHRRVQRFGFRTMEVREGDGLYVNGSRVILKGADRHSAWPESGRCLSEAVHRLDIKTMQEMNMNAVRMSHYPPDEQFLDLCDELGMYVLDELAGWHWCYDTPTGHKLVEEMVVRDVNHPSILFWDNGNEGGWNTNLDNDFSLWDPQQRKVLHPWTSMSGVNTAHYLTYKRAQAACDVLPMQHDKAEGQQGTDIRTFKSIYMPTEFLHGLFDGGAGAGMEDYWELMRRSKYIGGGFVWALLDEGIVRPEDGRMDVAGNRAPDGIVGPHREKEGSYFTIKEIWSPIVASLPAGSLTSRGVLAEGVGTKGHPVRVQIENRYNFLNANQCAFEWELRKFHLPGDRAAGFTVVKKGRVQPPSIAPGSASEIELDTAITPGAADAMALRVNSPAGRELWTWVWSFANADRFRDLVNKHGNRSIGLTQETVDVIEARVGELTVRINKKTGLLAGVQRGSKSFSLTNGPRPAVGSATLTGLEQRMDGADAIVTAKYEGDLQSVNWRVRANGWLQCVCDYTAAGPRDFFGVAFDYPEALVKKKKWLGDGPYRAWKNRRRGETMNVWENDYNNTITGWRGWVYPEFKGCFANVRWLQLETAEGLITAIPGAGQESFVQVLTPEFPPADIQAKSAVSLPKAGLAFLAAIPPLGSKFHPASDTGPQGQQTEAMGHYSSSVDFYFGPLP